MKNAPPAPPPYSPYADTTTGPIGTSVGPGYLYDPDRPPVPAIHEEPVSVPLLRGPDVAYLKSVSGVAKIGQIVFCFVGFIVEMSGDWFPGINLVSFAIVNGFLSGVIWFVLHLMNAIPQILANYYIELIMFMIIDVFLFIAAVLCSANGLYGAAVGFLSFVCFGATVAYTVDVVLQSVDIRQKFAARRHAADAPMNSRELAAQHGSPTLLNSEIDRN